MSGETRWWTGDATTSRHLRAGRTTAPNSLLVNINPTVSSELYFKPHFNKGVN